MKGWLQCTGHSVALLVSALALFSAGCEQDPTTSSPGSQSASAAETETSDAPGTAELAAANSPTVKFTTPSANKSYTVGDSVVATITVSNATLGTGAGEYKLQYFLDGVPVGAPVTTAASFTYGALVMGRHQLAVALVDQASEFLANEESLHSLHIKMKTTCAKSADCEDGLSC